MTVLLHKKQSEMSAVPSPSSQVEVRLILFGEHS